MIKRTLYFGNPAYLSVTNKQLVIRLPEVEKADNVSEIIKEKAVRTIPIEDVGVVMLDHKQITVTQALLEALMDNNVAVISCNSSHMPLGLLLPLCANTIPNERFRTQLYCSAPLRKQLWQQTIQAKIRNQAAILKRNTKQPISNMLRWANDVKSGDSDNLEARAAVYYWKSVFTSIPTFIRGREELPPNNLLNYGYAILRAITARALVASGMLPILGIHHHGRENAYCLADDIMEPYRPYVDQIVIDIVNSGQNYDELTTELKVKLLAIPTIDVKMGSMTRPLMIAVAQTTASLYKCFEGSLRKIDYPSM
ncbi:MAG: type II CRISPR-associated endonuclease Cas1 [Muribaculaceae bacterium]